MDVPGSGRMCTLEKEKGNKNSVILIIVIIILLAVIGVLAWMVLHPKQEVVSEETSADEGLAYDTGAVALDEKSLQDALDAMMAKDGTMALEMKMNAYSRDGMNYDCDIANSPRNKYDMYMILYLDETQEELYRSGLIPVGKRIDHLAVSRALESGTHSCTLTYVQVEDDHKTTHATLTVGLNLVVE
jgi:hypothetical protein